MHFENGKVGFYTRRGKVNGKLNENGNRPLVSVVMPAYNAERFITKAMESALNQTIEDIELIVVDDCSHDNTCELVEKLGQRDPRVRLVRNERNLGVAKSRNRGFEACRGSYVALLDSDDVWYPMKLEKQLALARREEADIVYCSYAMVNEEDAKICSDFIVPEKTDLNRMLAKNVISCSTVLMTGETVRQQSFSTKYYHEDYVYWLQLLGQGKKAVGVPEVLAAYRVYANTRASNKIRSAKYRWHIYREYMKFPRWKCAYCFLRYAFSGAVKYRGMVSRRVRHPRGVHS